MSAGKELAPGCPSLPLTAAVALASGGLMLLAARGDLWLDELWSLLFAGEARSAVQVLLGFRHDNNHPLNTLYLFLLGDQDSLILYRLLSVASGVGSVLLAGVAGSRWGRFEANCSMLLVALSYPLLLYFSEARGYAPAIFLGLAAYLLLDRLLRRSGRVGLVGFWLVSVMGILSHATFMMLSLALLAWTAAEALRPGAERVHSMVSLSLIHAPPLSFALLWYVFYLHGMEVGGGPVYSIRHVIAQCFILLLGLPDGAVFEYVASLCGAAVILAVAVDMARHGNRQWVFFLAVLLVVPALVLAIQNPKYIYFRYLLVVFPFFLLALSYLLGRMRRALDSRGKWPVLLLLLLLVAGQLPRDVRLVQLGRGHYTSALEYLVSHSPAPITTVGSDHDFRNRLLFDFYSGRVEGGGKLRYVPQSDWETTPPDWILVHSQEPGFSPPAVLSVRQLGEYAHVKSFDFAGTSGWGWFLFLRQE